MHAFVWTTILISIYYNHIFKEFLVLGEEVNANEDVNPASKQAIQEIRNKIDKMANTLLAYSSVNERSNALNILENKLKAADNLGQGGKKHIQLIMEGIKLKVLNNTKEINTSTAEVAGKKVDDSDHTDQHELVTEFPNKKDSLKDKEFNKNTSDSKESPINIHKYEILESIDVKQTEFLTNDEHSNNSRRMAGRIHEADDKVSVDNESNMTVDEHSLNWDYNINIHKISNEHISLQTPQSCHEFVNRTCADVKNMNRLNCAYERTYITLDKLCDGNPDCPFNSDENNCYSQAMEKFLYIKRFMVSIEMTKNTNCFQFDISRTVLSKQAKVLQSVLDKELNFKMKYIKLNSVNERNTPGKEIFNIKMYEEREANKIALIISSLALALDGALCANKLSFDTRRSNHLFDIDLDEEFKETLGSPKSCKCQNEFCVNDCTHYCRRLCQQKYSLTKWNCEAIDGAASISLNLLCDGKFDCFDESDEIECSTGMEQSYAKLGASEIFSNIHNMLQVKASKQRQPSQNKFLLLSNSIMKLQKLIDEPAPKLETIKEIRDKCYSKLEAIYSDTVKESDIGTEPEEAYIFLLSINQNLGMALKRSHTGNSKIINDRCQCKNGNCSVQFCSKICIRGCAVEPKLNRYYCGQFNEFVAMEKICDGVLDCSDGYDESNCKKDEICRRHHLVILRNNLQRIGENLKGTPLGELLSSWKLKVISTIKVVEKNQRPTLQLLKNVVKDILRDLVVTYGSIERYRRSKTADYALGMFLDISQIILESIKSCRI